MKRSLPLAVTLAAATSVMPAIGTPAREATPVPAPYTAQAELQARHAELLAAWSAADAAALERLVAREFFGIAASGDWLEREAFIASGSDAGPWRDAPSGAVEVRVFNEVALVQGVLERGDAGAPVRLRYTEGYHRQEGRWRLVHLQHTALREGVDVAARGGMAPAHAAWVGEDPQGDDEAVLRVLNENYVRAFREADVAWYDAHLSTGYGVVNSDGSLDSRAKALEEFSLPVFAQHLASFPVDKVRVRRFGDLAFVHAENDFRRKDGKRGVNRYTDVWARQWDGRWRCVSAHITTYRVAS